MHYNDRLPARIERMKEISGSTGKRIYGRNKEKNKEPVRGGEQSMYVVMGAGGTLGSCCIKSVLELTKERIIATDRDLAQVKEHERIEWMACDVRDDFLTDQLIEKLAVGGEPVKVIYLAAFCKPDQVQQDPDLAWNIHVVCLHQVIHKLRRKKDVRVFYISSDRVYGESRNRYHYKETDPLRPVSFYGYCRCAAESLILRAGYHVIRFPFLVSSALTYQAHFYDQIVAAARTGERIMLYEDVFRSAISFDHAADLLVRLIEQGDAPAAINICGDDDLSDYDIGRLIAMRERLDATNIIPIQAAESWYGFPVKRAVSVLMDNRVIKGMLRLSHIDIFAQPV